MSNLFVGKLPHQQPTSSVLPLMQHESASQRQFLVKYVVIMEPEFTKIYIIMKTIPIKNNPIGEAGIAKKKRKSLL